MVMFFIGKLAFDNIKTHISKTTQIINNIIGTVKADYNIFSIKTTKKNVPIIYF
jgi:hypothetical protein